MGSLGTTTSRLFSSQTSIYNGRKKRTVSPPLESTQLSQSAIPSHSSISVAKTV